jgi:hypothetical protein
VTAATGVHEVASTLQFKGFVDALFQGYGKRGAGIEAHMAAATRR